MGLPSEIQGYDLSKNIEVSYLKDGDHVALNQEKNLARPCLRTLRKRL